MKLSEITPCELLALTTLISQEFLNTCDADSIQFWGDFFAAIGANLIMLSDQLDRTKKTVDKPTQNADNKNMDKQKKNSSQEKVIALIAKQLTKDPKTIKLDQRIMEDVGADSLDIVEMLMNLEEEYGIAIPDDDAQNIKTVGELVAYLDKHQS